MQHYTRESATFCLVLVVVVAAAAISVGLAESVESLAARYAGVYINNSWTQVEPSSGNSTLKNVVFDFVPEETSGVLFCCTDRSISPPLAEVLCVYLAAPDLIRLHFSSPSLWWLEEKEMNYSLSRGSVHVELTFSENSATLQVAGSEGESAKTLHYSLPEEAQFYLGGIPDEYVSPKAGFILATRNRLFSGNIQGCLSIPTFIYANGLKAKGEPATISGQSGIASRCSPLQSECSPLDPYTCQHNGLCVKTSEQRWQCDCRRSNFTGAHCQNKALIVPLYLRQGYILEYNPPDDPLVFDITLHFRSKKVSGLIFCLVDVPTHSRVELRLESNHLILEVKIRGSKTPSLHSVTPIRLHWWYYIRVFSDRHYLTLQLDDLVVSTEAPLPFGLFTSSQFAVGDSVRGDADTIFEGCLRNLHTGLHKPTDVSLFDTTTCPGLPPNSTPTTPPPPPPPVVFHTKLGYVIEHRQPISILQFLLTTGDQVGVILSGFHDRVLSFTLFLSAAESLCLEWLNLYREKMRTCATVSLMPINITIEANMTHYSFSVGDGHVYLSLPTTIRIPLKYVNKLVFGGVPNSVSGFASHLLVDRFPPTHTTWIFPMHATTSRSPSPSTSTQHPYSSSAYSSPLASSFYTSSASTASTSSYTSHTFSTAAPHSSLSVGKQSSALSVVVRPTSTGSTTPDVSSTRTYLGGTFSSAVVHTQMPPSASTASTTNPVQSTDTSDRTENSTTMMKIGDIILVSVVSFLCVALLFVVVVVLVFFVRHCCQFLSNQTCDSHHFTAKTSLPEIEKNSEKETV